ncbi:hypothetical protein GCM10023322_76510 [Rugosimonospora acidiphila]|uniref:Uncharacterized protein n=1 Tax=Rugosimonospora acidiphila TaxID=556531 RepID=A0ABP9SQ40_9ACTN
MTEYRWHCPRCRAPIDDDRGFVAEYWSGASTSFVVWCATCQWQGEIVLQDIVTTYQRAEG